MTEEKHKKAQHGPFRCPIPNCGNEDAHLVIHDNDDWIACPKCGYVCENFGEFVSAFNLLPDNLKSPELAVKIVGLKPWRRKTNAERQAEIKKLHARPIWEPMDADLIMERTARAASGLGREDRGRVEQMFQELYRHPSLWLWNMRAPTDPIWEPYPPNQHEIFCRLDTVLRFSLRKSEREQVGECLEEEDVDGAITILEEAQLKADSDFDALETNTEELVEGPTVAALKPSTETSKAVTGTLESSKGGREMWAQTGGKLGYRYGLRPIEKLIAFGLSMSAVVWFAWKNQSLSREAGTGLLMGVSACLIVNMLGVSAMSEAWLLMAAVVLIGLKFGVAAFGMACLGWLLFTGMMFGILLLSNRFLYVHKTERISHPTENRFRTAETVNPNAVPDLRREDSKHLKYWGELLPLVPPDLDYFPGRGDMDVIPWAYRIHKDPQSCDRVDWIVRSEGEKIALDHYIGRYDVPTPRVTRGTIDAV